MLEEEIRLRLGRLLRGEVHIEDLSTIFLALRDLDKSRNTILEVGNFVAHRTERKHGLVTQDTKDFFVVTNFSLKKIYNKIDPHDLPQNIAAVLVATLKHLDDSILKKHTGIRKKDANRILPTILANSLQRIDGKLRLSPKTAEDDKLLQCLSSFIISKPAFDDQRLYLELLQSLSQHGFLKSEDQTQFRKLKRTIALYAVSAFHGSAVLLEDGETALLHGGWYDGKITTMAQSQPPVFSTVGTAMAIFQTSVPITDGCDPVLSNAVPAQGIWEFPIELRSDGKLSKLA